MDCPWLHGQLMNRRLRQIIVKPLILNHARSLECITIHSYLISSMDLLVYLTVCVFDISVGIGLTHSVRPTRDVPLSTYIPVVDTHVHA